MYVDTYRHTCRHAVSERCRKYPLDPQSMCGPRLMAFHPIASGQLPLECRPPIIQRRHTHARAHRELENFIQLHAVQLLFHYQQKLKRRTSTCTHERSTCKAICAWIYAYVVCLRMSASWKSWFTCACESVWCVRVLTPWIGRFCARQNQERLLQHKFAG